MIRQPSPLPGVFAITLFMAVFATGVCLAEEAKKTIADDDRSREFQGHHYLLVDDFEGLSWPTARDWCVEHGGHLAVITSREESDFISELCDERYMYLGASDAAEEGTWVWVDGTPWEFTNWLKGQPNDYSGNENYLATYDGGEWVDVDIEGAAFWMPTGFICETSP